MINLSYWVFPAFPTLKELAPEYDWDAVRENGLKLLSESWFGPRGLPADWQSVGGPSLAPAKNFPPQFGYNAIRIPLYLAWVSDDAARRALRRFAGLWRGKGSAGPFVIDVNTGATAQALDGAGYRLALALGRCASLAQPVEGDLLKLRDSLYYPATCGCCRSPSFRKGFHNVCEPSRHPDRVDDRRRHGGSFAEPQPCRGRRPAAGVAVRRRLRRACSGGA